MIVNILDYDADPTGVQDSYAAIMQAVNSLQAGDILSVPSGSFIVNQPIIYDKSYTFVEMYGEIKGNGIAFQGNKIRAYGVNVSRNPIWSDQAVGVDLKNCKNCEIHIDKSTGFNYGVRCIGEEAGFGYNNIYLGYIIDNKIGVLQTATGIGWCNENVFHGGRIAVSTNYRDANDGNYGWGWVFDKGNSQANFNNTRIINTCFESLHNGIDLKTAGYIYLEYPRFEGVLKNWVKQDVGAGPLTWMVGYGLPSVENCSLQGGNYNTIIGRIYNRGLIHVDGYYGITLDQMGDSPRLRASSGSLSVVDSSSGSTLIGNNYLKMPNGNGIVGNVLYLKNGTNKIFYSNNMPTMGNYTIGDELLNTAPVILGEQGSQYILRGWKRLTTGSNHVLGVDWVEMLSLTGS